MRAIFSAGTPSQTLIVEPLLEEAERTSCQMALVANPLSISELPTLEKKNLFFDLLLLCLLKSEVLNLDLKRWGLVQENLNRFERSLLEMSQGLNLTQTQLADAVAASDISPFQQRKWQQLLTKERLHLKLASGFLQVNDAKINLQNRPQLFQFVKGLFVSPYWSLDDLAARLELPEIPADFLRLLRDLVRQFNAEVESVTGLAKTLVLTRDGLRLTPFVCIET